MFCGEITFPISERSCLSVTSALMFSLERAAGRPRRGVGTFSAALSAVSSAHCDRMICCLGAAVGVTPSSAGFPSVVSVPAELSVVSPALTASCLPACSFSAERSACCTSSLLITCAANSRFTYKVIKTKQQTGTLQSHYLSS